MKKRNLIVRIISIVLIALLLLGVVTAAIYAFADGPSAAPATGSNDKMIVIAIALAVLAVAVIAVCVATSARSGKKGKKNGKDSGQGE